MVTNPEELKGKVSTNFTDALNTYKLYFLKLALKHYGILTLYTNVFIIIGSEREKRRECKKLL